MKSAPDMMSRHAKSSIFRLRPNHGVAFLDIEISASQLGRVRACFVEENLTLDGRKHKVLLPINSDNMLDNGAAWHPETFQPLGPNEVIWLTGHQGISPLLGHWLPLPYLRVMTDKAAVGSRLDQGPLNWVRIFISPPDGPLHEAATLKAVLAIDTQLAGGSRLDQRRYNAPSLEDVRLGSTFVLADDADQLSGLLSAAWLNDWLREIPRGDNSQPDAVTGAVTRFDQEHIARYLFLLKVLCEACPAPILRFASQTREQTAVEATANELILDLSDEVGLAVLIEQDTDEWSADTGRSRVLAIRDLAQPTNLHSGPLPVRVEFDSAQFGHSRISRQSGRSDAFKWSSLVRIGNEAARIALRPNATTGMTGSAGLARNVQDIAPIAGMWRRSTDTGPYGKLGPPSHSLAMQYLAESGEFIGTNTTMKPALRPRFSRSSLLTLFIAELVLQAVSSLNAPRNAKDSETTSGKPAFLSSLRLSLPISIEVGERDTLLARAREGIDFVWCAQGWNDDESGQAPPKPTVELGLGGDFGVQMLYLHGQLSDIYGGDLAAFVEDLNPVRKPINGARQVVQFASIAVGFSASRVVIADYSMVDIGGIRPRLVATQTEAQGLDDIHDAIIDHYLLPAVEAALLACNARLAADATDTLLGRRQPGKAHAPDANSLPDDVALGLVDKVLRPAARALLELYAGSPSGGARGIEWLTVASLVKRGGGRLEPMGDVIDNVATKIGANGFKLARVSVPFSRYTFRKAILGRLETLVAAATSAIDVDQTDLIFVTSTYSAIHDLRDLILSLVPISPHRLIVLDEQWSTPHDKIEHAGEIGVAIRVGVLSSVIGKRRLLGYNGLASIERSLQLEPEVA